MEWNFILKYLRILQQLAKPWIYWDLNHIIISKLTETPHMLTHFSLHFSFQISKMPGLGTRPSIYDIDIDTRTGEIEGLF